MTLPTARTRQTKPSGSTMAQSHSSVHQTATRIIEVVALCPQGTLQVAQHKAPALPLFNETFSAFSGDALIATPNGPIYVEDLSPGDLISTSTEDSAKLIWIGSSTFVPACPTQRTPLVRIMADTFGKGHPASFLTVGPAARLLQSAPREQHPNTPSMFTSCSALVDGLNIIELCPPTAVRMFHLCLERHATINAGGLMMESYHPGPSFPQGTDPEIRALFLSMFPRITTLSDFGPLAPPRATNLAPKAAV